MVANTAQGSPSHCADLSRWAAPSKGATILVFLFVSIPGLPNSKEQEIIVSRIFNYGVYGVGRMGKVHASIVRGQGHQIVAIGDEIPAAVIAAQDELDAGDAQTFNDPARMSSDLAGTIDAIIIASHTRQHARDALPFVNAHIPVYLEKPLTDDLREAFDFVETIGRDPHQIQIGLQR